MLSSWKHVFWIGDWSLVVTCCSYSAKKETYLHDNILVILTEMKQSLLSHRPAVSWYTEAGRKSHLWTEKVLGMLRPISPKYKPRVYIKMFISLDVPGKKPQSNAVVSIPDCYCFQQILDVETSPWRKGKSARNKYPSNINYSLYWLITPLSNNTPADDLVCNFTSA